MIRHLFKLMWNSKRNHALLIVEIFVSFLVLFAVWTMIIHNYDLYKRPMGFDYENVWGISFQNLNAPDSSLFINKEQIVNRIKAYPEVKQVDVTGTLMLFGGGTYRNLMHYEGREASTDFVGVGTNFDKVMNIPLLEGRWFTKADEAGNETAIIINQKLKEELFEGVDPIGKVIYVNPDEKNTYKKVVGVVENFKYQSDFQTPKSVLLEQASTKDWNYNIMVKVDDTADASFEANLSKSIAQIARGWQVEIEHLVDKKEVQNRFTYIPIIILLIVSSFLIFNVILGLFGILWYNINQRKEEIGVRRAMGATKGFITSQFIGEVVVIATFALIIGLFFAIQFPLLGVLWIEPITYVKAIVAAVLVIYGIVVLCAFYPSWQASTIHPAMALHEE